VQSKSKEIMPVKREDPVTISAKNGHIRCLLCGQENPWSLNLSFNPGPDGGVSAEFQPHSGLQGYPNILHGGVIAALLDAAMTHCLFHHNIQAVTGDLHVRFVQPVPCGSVVSMRALIVSVSTPLYHLKAELIHEGQIMAWAEAKFIKRAVCS